MTLGVARLPLEPIALVYLYYDFSPGMPFFGVSNCCSDLNENLIVGGYGFRNVSQPDDIGGTVATIDIGLHQSHATVEFLNPKSPV